MENKENEDKVDVGPQITFIFHDLESKEIKKITNDITGSNTMITNCDVMTVIDYRSGLIYKIRGKDNTEIISFRNTLNLSPPSAESQSGAEVLARMLPTVVSSGEQNEVGNDVDNEDSYLA